MFDSFSVQTKTRGTIRIPLLEGTVAELLKLIEWDGGVEIKVRLRHPEAHVGKWHCDTILLGNPPPWLLARAKFRLIRGGKYHER